MFGSVRWLALLGSTLGVLMAAGCGKDPEEGSPDPISMESTTPEHPDGAIPKSDAAWRAELTAEQYRILRQSGTEPAWGEAYSKFKQQGEGTYHCAGCGAELFTSKEKFDARCGWPAFFDASKHRNIRTVKDTSGGMVRVEVRCSHCDSHLGHVFEGEGFNTPTDQRYCINGVALKFKPPAGDAAEEGSPDPVGPSQADEDG